ncbi:hypothetical protein [Nocardioides panaciterrulae]|uniref:Type IV secretory pathway component VirB8 n=1 Tax=Nocardioides panaciterrulae TaxID=661492 RepID=A0A7Y9E4W7_9ACTN|nr:hypothetical protein [Nocardioides panaciterrulae]NYD41306.1 type IV secretory pathway component VirB8 [Nocardioides panaciterrulae]
MKRRAEVSERADRRSSSGARVAKVRVQVARLLWLLCALAALFLAVGALLIAVDANPHNALVQFVLDVADKLDVEVFSRTAGIKHFTGHDAATKNALVNWGLAAVAWLVVGRILDRVVRP